MLFNSPVFIFLFLPVTLIGFFVLGRTNRRSAIVWLVAASLFFYGWWNPAFVSLIVFSMLFNYAVGSHLSRTQAGAPSGGRMRILVAGIGINLSLLFYFKYWNFFIDNVNAVTGTSFALEHIVLPLGISFFTFQQITYLVDSYRGDGKAYDFINYALFVTFFPQLIAGPIVHHTEMMPQFERQGAFRFRHRDFAIGCSIFVIGLFKKVYLADNVALFATPVFDAALDGATLTFVEAWGGALGYTLQLYFDFSGYSDMAAGLARMFGIRLPLNFDSPYKATNIVDFWRRWHMTLSRFLRDYVYVPLGGNRRGGLRRYANLMATMLLGGLWHGAGWTFVIWGGLHGLYLVANHAWHRVSSAMGLRGGGRVGQWSGRLLTFLAVVVAWVFFRAESLDAAIAVLEGMAGVNGVRLPAAYLAPLGPIGDALVAAGWRFEADPGFFGGVGQVVWIAVLLGIAWFLPNTQELMRRYRPGVGFGPGHARTWLQRVLVWRPNVWAAAAITGLAMLSLLSLNRISEFLYFQF